MSPQLQSGHPVLAFDVGGTDIKSALTTASGELVDIRRTPTPAGADPATAVLDALVHLRDDYQREHDLSVDAIGLAIPGLIDERDGIALWSANLGWRDVPIRSLAEKRLGRPIALSHDVRSAAVAESRFGAGRESANMLAVIIGTGIASTLVINSVAYLGDGTAGEIGHGVFDPAGPPCHCGSRGCLENIVSARAMLTQYHSQTGRDLPGARELIELAQQGDDTAQAIWSHAISSLAIALTRASALLAPDTIVLGGGVSRAGQALFEPLAEQFSSLMGTLPVPVLRPAELGDDAGLIGSIDAAQRLAVERAS